MIRPHRLLALTVFLSVSGCYSLRPVRTGVVQEMGQRVDVTLNDAGRTALGPLIGPEVNRIDGTLLERDSLGLTLSVKHIIGLDGSIQVWSNELVRVEHAQVRTLSQRQFSPVRSLAFGAVGVGGAIMLVRGGIDPFGLGNDNDNGGKGDTIGNSIIRVIRP